MTSTELRLIIRPYRYHVLAGVYALITGAAIFRIAQQPYSRIMKMDQMETVFKATTLAAVVLGIGISGKINKPRSESS